MAYKLAVCPECSQKMTLRGLAGHLRFAHDYNVKDARKAMSVSEVGEEERLSEERSEKILDVARRWKEFMELEEFFTSEEIDLVGSRFVSKEVYEETNRYLIDRWNDCVSELRSLSGLDDKGHPVK